MVGATRGDWVKVRGLDVPAYRDSLQALFSNYNTTRSDICTIEQVEILKGPASVRVPPAGSSITQIGFGMGRPWSYGA